MATKIIIEAPDVWNYFQCHKEELQSHMHQIACTPEYGVEIFVTDESDLPNIVVTADDAQVYEETVVNEHDCNKTVMNIYDKYLTNITPLALVEDIYDDEDITEMEIEDIISERESELDSAVYEFYITVMNDEYYDDTITDFDDMLEDFKDHFIEYMARKYNLPIYRPMILEYEDGTEEVSDFPYEDMEFDDPDNPLYKA